MSVTHGPDARAGRCVSGLVTANGCFKASSPFRTGVRVFTALGQSANGRGSAPGALSHQLRTAGRVPPSRGAKALTAARVAGGLPAPRRTAPGGLHAAIGRALQIGTSTARVA